MGWETLYKWYIVDETVLQFDCVDRRDGGRLLRHPHPHHGLLLLLLLLRPLQKEEPLLK